MSCVNAQLAINMVRLTTKHLLFFAVVHVRLYLVLKIVFRHYIASPEINFVHHLYCVSRVSSLQTSTKIYVQSFGGVFFSSRRSITLYYRLQFNFLNNLWTTDKFERSDTCIFVCIEIKH